MDDVASTAAETTCRARMTAGFTLIELSVVLVIIGLIVGGVLVGQDLIKAAQIRGTITAMDRYKTAYNAFVLKYSCVPGDCSNASNFGLSWSQNCQGTAFTNGDGDGYIYSYGDGSTGPAGMPLFCESWNAINHLYSAGLIADSSSYRVPIYNTPIASSFMFFTSLRPNSPPAGYLMPDKQTNYLYIGTQPGNGVNFSDLPVLTPFQSYEIDSKIDDGLPMTGAVRATGYGGCNSSAGLCFNTPAVRSQRAFKGGATCVDDSSSPFVYWTSDSYSTAEYESAYALCNIHVPVD